MNWFSQFEDLLLPLYLIIQKCMLITINQQIFNNTRNRSDQPNLSLCWNYLQYWYIGNYIEISFIIFPSYWLMCCLYLSKNIEFIIIHKRYYFRRGRARLRDELIWNSLYFQRWLERRTAESSSGFVHVIIVFYTTSHSEIICGILFSCVLVIHFVQRWSVLRIAAGQLKRPGAGLRACPKKGSNHFKEEAFYSTSTLADHYCLSSTFARNGKWSTRTFWRQLYLAALFFLVIPSESGSRPIVIRSPKGYDHIVTDSDGSTELYIFSEPNGLLNPMSGIATIGGGAASFQPVAALSVNLMPPFDYTGSHLLANCARQAQQLRRRRHEPRLEPRLIASLCFLCHRAQMFFSCMAACVLM